MRTKSFKGTFFPYCKNEWNILKVGIRNAKSINIFKKSIVSEKTEHSLFCIYDPFGIKLLASYRLQFSHLNEHEFRHGFSDTINPMCACGTKIESYRTFPLALSILQYSKIRTF